MAPDTSTKSLPLAGIGVVEFTHMVMGPSAGMILADLGADSIKIEPAPMGDNTRRLTGPATGFFPTFNRNKRSLAVDMKKPAGLTLVRKLLKTADGLQHPTRQTAPLPTLPISLHGSRPGLRRQPPSVGQHGIEIMREAGFSDVEINTYISDGTLTTPTTLNEAAE